MLASAIAAYLDLGIGVAQACSLAKQFVSHKLQHASADV